jgi:hypothetical protein
MQRRNNGAQTKDARQAAVLGRVSRLRMRASVLRLIVLAPLLTGGCAGQIGEMPTWVGFEEEDVYGADDVSVVVLKVEPPARLLLAAGRIGPNGWRGKGPTSGVWISARDGFVVARVSPTQDEMAYAVIGVHPHHLAPGKDAGAPTTEAGFWSAVSANLGAESATRGLRDGGDLPAYRPTGQAHVPVLKAIARRVTFVGTVALAAWPEPDANAVPGKVGITSVTSPDDIEAVRRFMAQHYPKVRARVVASPLQMMSWTEPAE